MNIQDLREELNRQAGDRPDLAGLRADILLRNTARSRRVAAAVVAAATVAIVVVGIVIFRVTPGPRSGHGSGQQVGTPAGTSMVEPSVRRTMILVCGGPIAVTGDPDRDLTTVLGVVAINTQAQEITDQQVAGQQPVDPAERYFAKSGLQLRVGRSFTIGVANDQVGKVRMGWSNVAFEPGEDLQAGPCPAPSEPLPTDRPDSLPSVRWLTYPGGIWVAEPMCVHLVVTTAVDALPSGGKSSGSSPVPGSAGSALRRQTIHIPLGAPCVDLTSTQSR